MVMNSIKARIALVFFLSCFSLSLMAQIRELLQREIDKALVFDINMDTSKVTGWVIACIDNDSTWIYGYGRVAKTTKIAPDAHTIYEIGGLTKVFTGTIIHRMVEKKILHYDSTINHYLRPHQQFPLGNTITLLQLMTHTSGLPKLPNNFGLNEFSQDQPYQTYTEQTLFDDLKTLDSSAIKRGLYLYSHLNHAILEKIIENKGGYADLKKIENRLIDTTLVFAQGYNIGKLPVQPWRFDETFRYSLGIKASMNELVEFVKVHMGLKDTSQFKSLSETQKPLYKTNIDKSTYSGKIWHVLKQKKNVEICLQSGSTNGQSAFMAFVPNTKTGVIVLANSREAQGQLGMIILRALNDNWKRRDN
jgi:serine-type D-Ala-D-Ala carboxypeptidase/endopeptidase